MKLGYLERIQNKEKKFNENEEYIEVKVKSETGKTIYLMFTDKELLKGVTRAGKNPEDIQEESFLEWLFDK